MLNWRKTGKASAKNNFKLAKKLYGKAKKMDKAGIDSVARQLKKDANYAYAIGKKKVAYGKGVKGNISAGMT